MFDDTPHPEREQWPIEVKREAIRLRREIGLTHRRIRDRLCATFGADVPESTLANWVSGAADLPAPPTADLAFSVRELAARSLALLDHELTRMERASRKPLDLGRLERICRALKSLETVKTPSRNGQHPRTLADLVSDADLSV